MNGRVGLRLASFGAVIACAMLVACGGGGGGGGVTPGGGATATPNVAPTTQSTTAALSTSGGTTVQLGAISSGGVNITTSTTLGLPAVSTATTASISMSATTPSSGAPAGKKLLKAKQPAAFGIQSTLAYISVSFNQNVTLSSTPSLTIQLPAAVQTGSNWYLLFDDPSGVLGSGWQEIAPLTVGAGGTSLTLAATTLAPPITLAANTTYYFAISTTGTSPIPTPTTSTGPTSNPTGLGSPLPAVTETPGLHQGWTPYQVAHQFDFPVQHGYDGAGQTIAIIGSIRPQQSDITAFLARMGITRRGSYTVVSVNGEDTTNSTGGLGEATLDAETILALSPGANVEFYTIKDLTDASFQAAESKILTDPNHPSVMSISFGGCEDPTTIDADHAFFAQGAAKGIAYTVSSGDQGDACFYTIDSSNNEIDWYGVNSPASDPSVIAVGGNENVTPGGALNALNGTTVWNDNYFGGQSAAGSGVSAHFQSPSPAQLGYTGVLTSGRNVPDISFPAEGVSVYLQGAWAVYGGTSWSAPIAGALMAQIYNVCPALVGGTSQSPASIFYKATYNSTNFTDVTGGSNAWNSISTAAPAPTVGPTWTAHSGYDQASGLGLPNGYPVVQNICPGGVPVAGAGHARAEALTSGYGPSHDVDLLNGVRLAGLGDMGERDGSTTTSVWLTLRNTPTLVQDEQTVINALQGAGLHITQTYASHMLIEASGPTSAINAYFRTSIHNVNQGRFGARYANATSMTLPATIAPFVQTAIGNNLIRRKPLSYRIR